MKFLAVPFLALALLGCEGWNPKSAGTYALNTATIASNVVTIKDNYTSVRAIVASGEFSEESTAKLARIDQTLSGLIDKAEALTSGDVVEVTVNLTEIVYLYDSGRQSYVLAKEIIEPQLDSYSPADQARLARFDVEMKRLDASIASIKEDADGRDVTPQIQSLLSLVSAAINIAGRIAE